MSDPTTSSRTTPITGGKSAGSRQTLRVCADVFDEFTRECGAIRIDHKLNSTIVIDVLSDLFVLRACGTG